MGFVPTRSFFFKFVSILCTVPILYALALFVFTVLTITLPYKLLVYIITRISRPRLISFVHNTSGPMVVDDLYTRPHFTLLYFFVLDGVISVDRFREIFQERIINKTADGSGPGSGSCSRGKLVYERLQQFWTNFMGYSFWEWDTEFKIENYIKPCNDFYTRNDLPKLMSRLLSEPYKKRQSPWEIKLLNNYKENSDDSAENGSRKMVAILKINHALADGFSLLNILQRDLPLKLSPMEVPQPNCVQHSFWMKFLRYHCVLWELISYYVDSYDVQNKWIFPMNLKSAKEGAIEKYYCSISSGIEVSQVCAVKNKYNVSYLAVLLYSIFEGVRQSMLKEGQSVPDYVGFRFTRAKPNHPGGCSNHFYTTMIVLPMRKKSVKFRLEEIELKLKQEKLSLLPQFVDKFINVASWLPRPMISFLAVEFLPPGFGCSNFPVPKDVTCIENCKVTDLFVGLGSLAPQKTTMITMFGDGGKQSIVIHVDEESYSSQESFEKLGDYIKNEFNILVSSLQGTNKNTS